MEPVVAGDGEENTGETLEFEECLTTLDAEKESAVLVREYVVDCLLGVFWAGGREDFPWLGNESRQDNTGVEIDVDGICNVGP
jgi:hypothetical protein